MHRLLPVAAYLLVLVSPVLAQDRPGTVRVVDSKEIWKAEGMTVKHAQFTPDGRRIVFVAEGEGGPILASVTSSGAEFVEIWKKKGLRLSGVSIAMYGDQLDAQFDHSEASIGVAARVDGKGGAKQRQSVGIAWEGGPYNCIAVSHSGRLLAGTKDLPSPVGVVRGAGLWAWRPWAHIPPWPRGAAPEGKEDGKPPPAILSPKEWLVGVAYYKHMIAWAPIEKGKKESRRIRFIGARIKPFPGMKYRPLCVWEVSINDKLERVGEPKRLGTFGWWPRYFRGDPALHGCTAWNVGIGHGQYMANFSTGKVYKFEVQAFGRGTRATYNPGCTLAALPGKTLRVLKLEKTD